MNPLWEIGKKVYINGTGHITKMVAMPMYGKKPLKLFFSRTKNPMILTLGMYHWGLKLYKVYKNDDPVLTLTLITCFCTYSRPLYQVSVYRTIGPLVLNMFFFEIAWPIIAKYYAASSYEKGNNVIKMVWVT